jgi:5,6-dimethylbenzimidazole synthase
VIQRVMRARRDIRHFTSTPIPDGVLLRIFGAARAAPLAGLMQPWDFILVNSPDTRSRIRASFESVNAGEKAKLGGTERGQLYSSLKLEGILEAPVNIAVTCDHSRGGPCVLGRAPMPQTATFGVCLAIENLWLAARAEGIRVGWVARGHRSSRDRRWRRLRESFTMGAEFPHPEIAARHAKLCGRAGASALRST